MNFTLEEARRKGAWIPPPASTEDLRQCQKALKAKWFPFIPQRYFAFLKNVCNGFAYGSVQFYGTKPFISRYDSSDAVEDDLVTANEKYNKNMKYRLVLGYGWDTAYFYNTKTGLYETRSNIGGELFT